MQSEGSFKDRQSLFAFRIHNTATVGKDEDILNKEMSQFYLMKCSHWRSIHFLQKKSQKSGMFSINQFPSSFVHDLLMFTLGWKLADHFEKKDVRFLWKILNL